jgi:F-type H+-transporting ATPase subunit a
LAEAHESPLEQFRVHPLVDLHIGGVDVSFTNASLFMLIAVAAITLFMVAGMRSKAIVPGRFQGMVESFYEFIATMLTENIGKEGIKYFPFVFSLFMFVMFANLIGMLPGGFTVTSHIIVTFALAMLVILLATFVGFKRHGLHFFGFFVPKDAPIWLMPLMIPIEVISYCVRPISLSVRLFANMVAGHVMLAVIGGFVVALGSLGGVLTVLGGLPLALIVAIFALEVLVALLQAYVFAILTCIYLNDAVHMAH